MIDNKPILPNFSLDQAKQEMIQVIKQSSVKYLLVHTIRKLTSLKQANSPPFLTFMKEGLTIGLAEGLITGAVTLSLKKIYFLSHDFLSAKEEINPSLKGKLANRARKLVKEVHHKFTSLINKVDDVYSKIFKIKSYKSLAVKRDYFNLLNKEDATGPERVELSQDQLQESFEDYKKWLNHQPDETQSKIHSTSTSMLGIALKGNYKILQDRLSLSKDYKSTDHSFEILEALDHLIQEHAIKKINDRSIRKIEFEKNFFFSQQKTALIIRELFVNLIKNSFNSSFFYPSPAVISNAFLHLTDENKAVLQKEQLIPSSFKQVDLLKAPFQIKKFNFYPFLISEFVFKVLKFSNLNPLVIPLKAHLIPLAIAINVVFDLKSMGIVVFKDPTELEEKDFFEVF